MIQRDWQKDMDSYTNLKEWHENDWMAGTEEGTGLWLIHEIVPDEPCQYVAECENELVVDFIMTAHSALPYWLQEAKERGEREQRLKEAVEEALKWTWYHGEANMTEIDTVLNDILATLYPDTPAPKEDSHEV